MGNCVSAAEAILSLVHSPRLTLVHRSLALGRLLRRLAKSTVAARGCPIVQRLMAPAVSVEVEIGRQGAHAPLSGGRNPSGRLLHSGWYARIITVKMLSLARPLPSILICTPAFSNNRVYCGLVK